MDYLASLVYPSDFKATAEKFDDITWDFLQHATGLFLPMNDEGLGYEYPLNTGVEALDGKSIQNLISSIPKTKGGLGLRKMSLVSNPAFIGGAELSLLFFTGEDGLLRSLESLLGRPDLGEDHRWSTLIGMSSHTGLEFLGAWNNLRDDAQECCRFLD